LVYKATDDAFNDVSDNYDNNNDDASERDDNYTILATIT
jgi:hypothetical protein